MFIKRQTKAIKRETIFEYLFVILLILECRSIFVHLANCPVWLNYVIVILFTISIIGCMVKVRFTNQQLMSCIGKTIFIWVFLGIFMIVMPYNVRAITRIGIILTLFFIFYTLYCKNNGYSIMLKYRNLIFVLAIISLFFWIFGFVLGWIKPTTSVVCTWTGENKLQEMYFYLSGSTQNISGFGLTGFPRNTSIFTEAPMSSLHFSLAYIFEEFKNHHGKMSVKIVLIIAILSTFSTTGYIILVITFMYKFMTMKTNNKILRVAKYILIVFVVILGCYVLYYLFTGKLGTRSGTLRLSDFVNGFQLWSEHPIWGYGFRYEDITGSGFSNSVTPVLLSGGIYAMSIYIYMFGKGIYGSVCKRDWNGLVFIGLFMFEFILTIVPFQYLTFFVLIYITDDSKELNGKSIKIKNFNKQMSEENVF